MPLSRNLGFAGTATLSAGGMVPTLSMPVTGVQAARLLGRELPLAYLPALVAVLLTGRGFALSAALSHTGTVYAFIGKALVRARDLPRPGCRSEPYIV